MRLALALVFSLPTLAHAHVSSITRGVVIEPRDDGSLGLLVVFDVPRGAHAALIRAGLDADLNGTLSADERSRGVRAWAETGLRDLDVSVAGSLAECRYETNSTLGELPRDDSPFSVAALIECTTLEAARPALWQVWVGAQTKTRVRVGRRLEGALVDAESLDDATRAWRRIELLF